MKQTHKPQQGSNSRQGGSGGGATTKARGRQAPGPRHVPGLLSRGSRGPNVRMLQISLKKAGFEPGPIDGDFGPLTHGAVIRFQTKRGLGVDGIVGPQTWGALRAGQGAPTAGPEEDGGGGNGGAHQGGGTGKLTKEAELRAEILRVAQSQIGTTESGENRGAAMKYQKFFGRGPEPWCADFVSWVYSKAGKATNNPYTPTFVQQLKKQGKWKGVRNPEPGDLVFFDWEGDGVPDHVAIVKNVKPDGSIVTIEGNTGHPKTGQEGVWQKTRDLGNVLGFASV